MILGFPLHMDVHLINLPRSWSVPHIMLTWILGVVFAWRLLVFALSTRKLIEMKVFYEHLLDIPNASSSALDRSAVLANASIFRATSKQSPGLKLSGGLVKSEMTILQQVSRTRMETRQLKQKANISNLTRMMWPSESSLPIWTESLKLTSIPSVASYDRRIISPPFSTRIFSICMFEYLYHGKLLAFYQGPWYATNRKRIASTFVLDGTV